MRYEWDEGKREANKLKHGVDFDRAESFDWETALTLLDDRQDYGEPRYIALGRIAKRLYVMVYTVRGEAVRIIGLRKANDREVKYYEAQT